MATALSDRAHLFSFGYSILDRHALDFGWTVAATVLGTPGVSTQALSSVRRIQILLWSNRHNPGRIDVIVGVVVMPFDVVEVDGLGNPRLLIKISQIAIQVRIIDDTTDVAFEMSMVNRVKPNKRYEQAPIGFQRLGAKKKSLSGESIIQII
jgi:hypothetical protein